MTWLIVYLSGIPATLALIIAANWVDLADTYYRKNMEPLTRLDRLKYAALRLRRDWFQSSGVALAWPPVIALILLAIIGKASERALGGDPR